MYVVDTKWKSFNSERVNKSVTVLRQFLLVSLIIFKGLRN